MFTALKCHHAMGTRPTAPARAVPRVERARVGLVVRAKGGKTWRPNIDDVERISFGQKSKTRGTGSRRIPHRLNQEERSIWERAKKKNFLAVRGTAYRKERKGHPLPNIFRQWCDANERACVVVEQ
eukprot:gene32562-12480_t